MSTTAVFLSFVSYLFQPITVVGGRVRLWDLLLTQSGFKSIPCRLAAVETQLLASCCVSFLQAGECLSLLERL